MPSQKERVIIAGFGRVGKRVAKAIYRANIPYVALDSNPDQVHKSDKQGFNVFYGNALLPSVLKAAGIDNASSLVITFRHKKEVERLIKIMSNHYPDIPIFVRARDRKHCERLLAAGADISISEVLEAGLELGGAVLKTKGMSEEEMQNLLQDARQDYYAQVAGID